MNKKELFKKLNLDSFIAFDFETTGLDPQKDRIIEIAAIRFVDGEPADRFVTLLNPGFSISETIIDITGITNAMVANMPEEDEIIGEFLEFLGEEPLVAHNISFDISFLNLLRERHEKPQVEHRLYDTLQLARTFLFDQPAFNLGSISEYYGLSAEGAHRAESDAENGGEIFVQLVQEAASYPISVMSKILALVKSSDLPNKTLFVDIANTLTQLGIVKKGLVSSKIDRPRLENIFSKDGKSSIGSLSVKDVFGHTGLLHKSMDKFEERPEQTGYSEFVEDVISGEPKFGVAEAGTGLGKSMAYLFPALKRVEVMKDEGPTIISCHTKHLQDQLFYKDLPMLAEALDVPIRAIKLKGRSNYICRTRLDWVISDAENLLNNIEMASLLPLLIWLEWTKTGDLSECNGFWSTRPRRLASMIRSEPGFCTTSVCSRYKGCFFGKVRRSLFDAQIIIINHALLLSEIKSPGFLPLYNAVIIDEAHNLVGAAYSQLSLKLDKPSSLLMLNNVDPTAKTNQRWSKILKAVAGLHPEFLEYLNLLEKRSKEAIFVTETFFNTLILHIEHKFNISDAYPRKVIVDNLTEEYGSVNSEIEDVVRALHDLKNMIGRIAATLLEKDAAREDYPDLHQALDQRMEIVKELLSTFTSLIVKQEADWVYWQEGQYRQTGKKGTHLYLSLRTAPVEVAGLLSAKLFSSLDHCVLTSATLKVDDAFQYFIRRSGLDRLEDKRIVTKEFPSPFYYNEQVTYWQYGGRKSITTDSSEIASIIYRLHQKQQKRIMVLFTAHAALNGTYQKLRKMPGGRDLPIFAQVYGTSRYAMIKGMRSTESGILMGTNSFWEGVDLPGDLLEILVITKLPFDVPSEPVVKAYSNMISTSGGNSFIDYSVPECVTKFRQGFGRLIRTTLDQGIFIVLDNRIVIKGYGKHFMDAIPVRQQVFANPGDLSY